MGSPMNRTATEKVLVMLFLSYSFALLLYGCGATLEGMGGIPPVPSGNSITLSWKAPDKNSDGSPLEDLAGFRVYYGLSTGSYTDMKVVRGETTCRIENLPGNVSLYIAVSAFDTSMNDSELSEELVTFLPPL